jgi:hypothetical protein
MSSFSEIKNLFVSEILNTPQYQVALKIKNLLIEDILAPNLNLTFIYIFQDEDYSTSNKDHEENIIFYSLQLILGFEVGLYNDGINRGIQIVMKNFLL